MATHLRTLSATRFWARRRWATSASIFPTPRRAGTMPAAFCFSVTSPRTARRNRIRASSMWMRPSGWSAPNLPGIIPLMRKKLAEALGIVANPNQRQSQNRRRLGFVGRGEAVRADASAFLVKSDRISTRSAQFYPAKKCACACTLRIGTQSSFNRNRSPLTVGQLL